ncbi:DUF2817 domain-containing protein, partial [bacterium]|nr:DUF2817 domain-containing protein [bacterium]
VNPWGFKNGRRVNRNNVDLGRNFTDGSSPFNWGYRDLFEFLNPRKLAAVGGWRDWAFAGQSVYQLSRSSMAVLRQAILQGQYSHPQGIYYGGSWKPEAETLAVSEILGQIAVPYKHVYLADIHTGYGQRGKLHLIPPPTRVEAVDKALRTVYGETSLEFPGTGEMYKTQGDLLDAVSVLSSTGKTVVPVVYEFGTMDSQTTLGAIRSLHNIIAENQGYQWGYASEAQKQEIRRRFAEMFYPTSPEWRDAVLNQARSVLEESLGRFEEL